MAQNILSNEFAREAFLAGNAARQEALDAGLPVGWFDDATQRYYIDQNGRRFLAEIVDGQLQPVGEINTGSMRPRFILLGGPNGSGKSTLVPRIDPEGLDDIINPDTIR